MELQLALNNIAEAFKMLCTTTPAEVDHLTTCQPDSPGTQQSWARSGREMSSVAGS